jgi:hypothetical protein
MNGLLPVVNQHQQPSLISVPFPFGEEMNAGRERKPTAFILLFPYSFSIPGGITNGNHSGFPRKEKNNKAVPERDREKERANRKPIESSCSPFLFLY